MLTTGARLGLYEVMDRLGAGGMGEVWRARDTRLGRDVALKVLPEAFAGDAARRARFEREARMLAALNHPGIATIHGFECVDGVSLLVQELVDGPTLAERLRRGPLAVREALQAAIRIAEALEAAHEKGIVHRDLKPSNIKLLPDGRVKVLDFGLARMLGERPADEISQMATDTEHTAQGAVLGTAPYMSPEQTLGEPVDARTDVWALGCVLYEMLSGARAFSGPTASGIIAAILEREPDWAALPADTPPAVHAALRRCLQKDKSRRLRAAADAAIAIEDALASPSVEALRAPASRTRSWLPTGAAAILALAAGLSVSLLWTGRTPLVPGAALRLNIDVPPELSLPGNVQSGPIVALSTDGSSIVFQAEGKGLYLRPLDGTEAVAIRGTERGIHPFFSPDGRWIGFQANGKLQKVPVGGGAARIVANALSLRGASWAEDGTIVYTPVSQGGLFRVSAEGGAPQALTEPDPAVEVSHRWPQVLPGGAVLYTSYAGTGQAATSRIAVLSTARTRKVLVEGGTYGRYIPTGHLLYASGGTVFAAPFDVRRLELTGPSAPVLEDVRMAMTVGTGVAFVDFSRTGVLVYVGPYPQPRSVALVRVGRDGSETPLSDPRRGLNAVRISPDGRRLIVGVTEPDGSINLWRYELANGSWTQLTFGNVNGAPTWSPHGDRIAFASNRSGEFRVLVMSADGGAAEPLAGLPSGWCLPTAWSLDGQALLFTNQHPQSGIDLWELPLDAEAAARPLLVTPRHEAEGRLSPDGRWIAYEERDAAGRTEIYVRPRHGADRKWAIANDRGPGGFSVCCPRWSRSGQEVLYLAHNVPHFAQGRGPESSAVMAVRVWPSASTLRVGSPQTVFDRGRRLLDYDLMPDGREFVIAEDVGEPEHLRVVIVPNWFDELTRKVPGGRGMR